MAEEHRVERVLISARGVLAHQLIAHYRSKGIETVAGFSEPDAEAAWLEEADFDAYLNGTTVSESYGHPEHVVSAAMDAGCDAIHPGASPFAESVELFHLANQANVAVLSGDPTVILRCADRAFQRGVAARSGLAVVPASAVLADPGDGLEAAISLGLPIEVRTSTGAPLQLVSSLDSLPDAVAQARDVALASYGSRDLYLQRCEPKQAVGRTTLVVAERTGRVVSLGTTTAWLRGPQGAPWVEELGPDPDETDVELGKGAVAVVRGIRWVSVCAVRWSMIDDAPFFTGVSVRLPSSFDLFDAVHGLEILDYQVRLLQGKPLGWGASGDEGDRNARPNRWGVQVQLVHGDGAADRPDGTIAALALPEGAVSAVVLGQKVGPQTPPVLAKITVVADDRSQAWERMREVLKEVVLDGVPSNLDALRRAVASRS